VKPRFCTATSFKKGKVALQVQRSLAHLRPWLLGAKRGYELKPAKTPVIYGSIGLCALDECTVEAERTILSYVRTHGRVV